MISQENQRRSPPAWAIATIVGVNPGSLSVRFASSFPPIRQMPPSLPRFDHPCRRIAVVRCYSALTMAKALTMVTALAVGSGLAFGTGSGAAQEVVPTPQQAVDPDSPDPFQDDSSEDRATNAGDLPPVVPAPVVPAPVVATSPSDVPAAGNHRDSMIAASTLDWMHGPLLRRDLRINGAQSCAAAACHGGPIPGVLQPWVRRGAAYQLWKENDPHSQSWRTMCSDESLDMMRRLKIVRGDKIVDQSGFDNCLGCHNTTRRYDEPRSPVSRHEGVGCAGCHGPSELWIGDHFQQHWSPISAQQEGFINAGDLYVRARMCASCHVGDKDRDMNHDIIAAGHPTLRYELATYHAWQPKHWRDRESEDKSFYEAQLWLAGQVAATDASLALLETRANNAHTVSEWPEFAAYNCASCHHALGLDNDRDPIGPARTATAIYSQWNDAGIRWLLRFRQEEGLSSSEDTKLIAALDAVRQSMETRPRPSADAVALASSEARKMLAAWFESSAGKEERRRFRSDRLGRLIASAAGNPQTFQSWESAAQFYLAAVAARESWPGGWNGPLRDVADRLQHGLHYPEMIDISRFSKRAQASGPEATRMGVTRIGVELAGWLGPVKWEPQAIGQQHVDPAKMEADLDALLRRIGDRWQKEPPAKVPPADDAPNRTKRDRPDRDQPKPVQPNLPKTDPADVLEELRKSFDALQSGESKAGKDE